MKKMARNSNSIWQVFAALAALTASHSVLASEMAARVVTVRGDVVKYGEWNLTQKTPLKPNETILEGDTIEAKAGGAVKLLFTDKTIVDIGADTTFRVKEYRLKQGGNRQVNLELKEGKIRTSVNQPVGQSGSFRLKTRSVVMGVRGTEFVVESREALAPGVASPGMVPTQITVLEGNVAVAQTSGANGAGAVPDLGSGNVQSVSAGQQLTAGVSANAGAAAGSAGSQSQSGGVQTLSAGQAAAVAQSATVTDNTFKASVNLESSSESKGESKAEAKTESKAESKGEAKAETKAETKGEGKAGGADASKQASSSSSSGSRGSSPETSAQKPAALAQLAAVVQASAAAPPPRIDVGNLGVPGANSVAPPPTQQTTSFSVVGQPTSVRIQFTP